MRPGSFKLLVIMSCYFVIIESKSKHVNVQLEAKWQTTPVLLEASEFVAKESNTHFWRFVNDLYDKGPIASKIANDEENYRLALKLAEKIISPLQLRLLKLALSLRAHSPTVEMHYQIAMEKSPPTGCSVFVEVNNMITCEESAMRAFINMAKDQQKPTLVTNDHVYPGSGDRDIIVILYAQLGTTPFLSWHLALRTLADEGRIMYVLRHYVEKRPERKVRLSGYGVELAIKNQEYKATDDTKVQGSDEGHAADEAEEVQGFIFSTLKNLHPELTDNLNEFKEYLLDSTKDMAPLKVWQLQDLSYQAAQRVMSTSQDEQLRTLRDISQNFPVMARSLIRTAVSDAFRQEVKKNQEVFMSTYGLEPGESAMFINGLQAHLDVYDVFTLAETMRSEAKLMEGLYKLGNQYEISGQKMMDLLTLDLRDTDVRYAVDIRDTSIVYLNNLEKDKRYAGWPSSVQDILRPTFPGMLRHVRKNFFHLIFMVNPANKEFKDLIKMAEAFFVHNAPIRVGLLFVVNQDLDDHYEAGLAMVRAFNYISEKEDTTRALSFITDVLNLDAGEIEKDDVVAEFSERSYKASDIRNVFETDYYDGKIKQAAEYFDRTGLGELPQVLVNGVPMKKHEMDPDEFEESVVSGILQGTNALQTAVYNNKLTDRSDVLEYLMEQNNVVSRLNSRILSTSERNLDLTADIPENVFKNRDAFTALHPEGMASVMLSNMKYLVKKGDKSINSVTNWIIADLNTAEGRSLMYAAVKHLKHSAESRIGIVHNPRELPGSDNKDKFYISHAVQTALDVLEPSMAKSFITKLLKEENVMDLKNGEKTLEELAVHNMDFAAYDGVREAATSNYLFVHRAFVEKVLNFAPGERGVVCNGKVLGPLKAGEVFIQEDFDLLDKYTNKVSSGKVKSKVQMFGGEGASGSDLIMRISSLLMSVSQNEGRKDIKFWDDNESVITLPPSDDSLPAYEVVAILDPTTRAAQKYTPILMVLQEVANVDIKVYFNCREKLSEMPLKSFYRYVLEPELMFAVDSSLSSGPMARFQNMPETPLLTLGMDPPESWLVEGVNTPYDLDNIYLAELDSSVHANYELEYLLLEGHCYDSVSGQPPRGLQFILGSNTTHDIVDTIVMANLGYFQLKATPGMWNLRLRPGRSYDIYDVSGHELTDSPSNSQNIITVIDSFKTKIVRIKVNKKPGMENVDLLDEEEQKKGLWDSISSTLTGTAADGGQDTQTINIFTLASGHLYERLMRIMMVSVMKHTKTRVKFWFLKNYLSPTFMDFIPHMAKEYDFDYQLVQYKWPRWLHQQTEKQRIIWGYKILFLDVLFPLNVSKIIFVDADQIVRTDMKELMEFDLEGAPYGYTPFCDSRKEMDGFRFWKSGYWASHLAGRKYHISALYVVDLKKFRKIAAGDRLRGQYQGLSQDPNSLSNLDQDLPNNMIHQVAIKSLPQEWLYCDTWCSSDTLKNAKTIDLCNNPQTKEPKLSAAVRLAPEWTVYDQEIKLIWDRVYGTKTATENISSPDSQPSPDTQSSDESKDEL